MSLASVAYREVEGIVETWTKKYQYHISLIETKPNEVKYQRTHADLWQSSVYHNHKNLSPLPPFASTSLAPTTISSESHSASRKTRSFTRLTRPSASRRQKYL